MPYDTPSSPATDALRHAARYRRRPHHALPFVLADADALRELFESQNQIMRRSAHPPAWLPEDVLSCLSQPDRSTLIIPRMVMNELMRYEHQGADGTTLEGSFDFYINDKGAFDFCTAKQGLVNEGRPLFAEYLDVLRDRDMLRCYPSMQAMVDHGELRQPRGGVVIVDTDSPAHIRPISSRGVSFIRTTLPEAQGGETITHTATRDHAGDYALARLARFICQRAPSQHQKGSLLLVSNDTQCKELVGNSCLNACERGVTSPNQMGVSNLIHTLEYAGLLPVEANQAIVESLVSKRYRTAARYPRENEPTVTAAARASYNQSSARYMNQCLDWLEATGLAKRQPALTR